MDRDEQLLGDIARRNWIILGVLVAASLLWRSPTVTAGVLSGGLVAIIGYRWLFRSLRRMLADPTRRSARSFQINYLIRLGALAVALFLLVAVARVHPVGLAAGLSVVVINILLTTLKRTF